MRKTGGRVGLVTLLFAITACVAASCAQASPAVRYGIQDDAWLEFGPGTLNQRLATFKRLGVPLVRFTLHWDQIAPRRPGDATSPRDRAYDWHRSDRVLQGLHRYGLTPVLTLVGTPAWANGGKAANFAPPRPRDFRRFATAAAASLPLGSLLADLERAEQAPLAAADEGGDLRPASAQPGFRGDSCRAAPCPRGWRGDGAPRGVGRSCPRYLGSRHGRRAREARRLRAPSVSVVARGDAVERWVQELPVDHDGDDPEAPDSRQAILRAEAGLADRVRLPDETARRLPGSAAEAASDDAQPRRVARLEAGPCHDSDPVPVPRRGRAQPLPDRARLRRRPSEAIAAGVQAAVRANGAPRLPGGRLGADPRRTGRGGTPTASRCCTRTSGRPSGTTG